MDPAGNHMLILANKSGEGQNKHRGNWPDSGTPEYEQAMLNAILVNTVNRESVLVLCGEFHRGNISRALARNGGTVEDRDFNWVTEI
jgi:hypothetical protein